VCIAFGRSTRGSVIVATSAGKGRGYGRGGRRRKDTGKPRQVNSNGTGKAGVTGSVSGAENHQQAKSFRTPRG